MLGAVCVVVVLGWSVFLSAVSAASACAGVAVPGWAVSFFWCVVCVLGAGWSACSRAVVAQGGNLFGVDRKLLFKMLGAHCFVLALCL